MEMAARWRGFYAGVPAGCGLTAARARPRRHGACAPTALVCAAAECVFALPGPLGRQYEFKYELVELCPPDSEFPPAQAPLLQEAGDAAFGKILARVGIPGLIPTRPEGLPPASPGVIHL